MEENPIYLRKKQTFSKEAIETISENLLKNGSVYIFKNENNYVFSSGKNVSNGETPDEAVLNSETLVIRELKTVFKDMGVALKGGYCS